MPRASAGYRPPGALPGRCLPAGDPRQRPGRPAPQSGPARRPGYPDGARDRYGERPAHPGGSSWPPPGHDGNWYPDQPPWDDGAPEADLGLRYREPGPGMPGYRGSRDHRYGGDVRDEPE